MSQTQQQHTNGNSQGNQMQRQIRDELDALEDILKSSDDNPLLDSTNLGQGNYSEDYLWQQIRSYRKGLWAHNTFASIISDRHKHETIMALGEEGYNPFFDDDTADVTQIRPLDTEEPADDAILGEMDRKGVLERDIETYSTWTLKRRRGEYIWRRKLGDPEEILTDRQIAALYKKSGGDGDWKPVYWQMVQGRHEASRSQDARLIKLILGNVKELRETTKTESGGGLLS